MQYNFSTTKKSAACRMSAVHALSSVGAPRGACGAPVPIYFREEAYSIISTLLQVSNTSQISRQVFLEKRSMDREAYYPFLRMSRSLYRPFLKGHLRIGSSMATSLPWRSPIASAMRTPIHGASFCEPMFLPISKKSCIGKHRFASGGHFYAFYPSQQLNQEVL